MQAFGHHSNQEPSKFHPNLHLVFDRIWDRCLIDVGWIFDPQIQKSTKKLYKKHPNNPTIEKQKCFKTHRNLQYNRALGHVMLSTKIDKNRPNILQKTAPKSMLQLGSILEPTWPHFVPQNPPKMKPSGLQNRSKLEH